MSSNHTHANPLECNFVSEACPVEDSIYGYRPNLGATYFFVILFAVCFIANVALGIKYGKRTATYTVAMTLATACAAIGNGGRIPMHNNPFDSVGFQIQICCLTLSPAFNSAAIYLILKHIVRCFGREWSRIRPKFYTWGFIVADFLALVLQAAGGGLAATSTGNNTQLNLGTNLMLTGIVWQVVTLVVFGIMVSDYIVRRSRDPAPLSDNARTTTKDTKFRIFACSLPVVYFAVLIRCIYRIAEMARGWQNPLMQDQITFLVLDSTMVAIASLLQTFVHPGYCFLSFCPKKSEEQNMVREEEKHMSDSSAEQVV